MQGRLYVFEESCLFVHSFHSKQPQKAEVHNVHGEARPFFGEVGGREQPRHDISMISTFVYFVFLLCFFADLACFIVNHLESN